MKKIMRRFAEGDNQLTTQEMVQILMVGQRQYNYMPTGSSQYFVGIDIHKVREYI